MSTWAERTVSTPNYSCPKYFDVVESRKVVSCGERGKSHHIGTLFKSDSAKLGLVLYEDVGQEM